MHAQFTFYVQGYWRMLESIGITVSTGMKRVNYSLTGICLKLTMETLEKYVKSVQS